MTIMPSRQRRATTIWGVADGPPFHGSRSSRELRIQNESSQMAGREVSENPRVRKNFVRNSGPGNGCANFMGGLENAFFFLQEKAMSIKFLVLGGVFWVFFWGGGGKCRFYFYGREDFSESYKVIKLLLSGGK